VYDDPETLFVAGFIGSPSMNFIPGKRVGDEVEVGGGQARLPLPPELRARAGEKVTVGIRPEHLVASGDGPVLRFTVDLVEALGADALVHGSLGDATVIARMEGHSSARVGDALVLRALPGRLYFFDAATGKRLRPGG
jgi:sn-glycerol 3-phosphate transport system ATP-binding protein